MDNIIRPFDVAALRTQYQQARPFPYFCIDNFLEPAFAAEVVAAYPVYEEARAMGREFSAVNERLKVQITDSNRFPAPVRRLSDALSSAAFLERVEQITGIDALLADQELDGGGMHLTGPTGRLDVHVDFNLLGERRWHRRLNILLYLNPEWPEAWGGNIEFWDQEVKNCIQSYQPMLNRCVVFETSDISYHGVSPVKCPTGQVRKSFAAYYYTKEAPAGWDGAQHDTVFRARPNEVVRRAVLMPAERIAGTLQGLVKNTKRVVRKTLGR